MQFGHPQGSQNNSALLWISSGAKANKKVVEGPLSDWITPIVTSWSNCQLDNVHRSDWSDHRRMQTAVCGLRWRVCWSIVQHRFFTINSSGTVWQPLLKSIYQRGITSSSYYLVRERRAMVASLGIWGCSQQLESSDTRTHTARHGVHWTHRTLSVFD